MLRSMICYTTVVAILANAAPTQTIAMPCNGSPVYCDRRYSNISLIGTHDSAFVGSILDPRVNQEKTVAQQLDAGIRFLQAQTHKNGAGILSMCHTSCSILDAGPLATYLSGVKQWLDGHPNEVVTMLLVNGDNLSPAAFGDIFAATGMRDYAFIPPSSPRTLPIDTWPTLNDMIMAKRRLVVFLDSKADTSQVSYLLPEFDYFFETPYDTTDPDFNQCTLDRPAGSKSGGKMYIVNHFLDKSVVGTVLVPDNAADYRTNAASGKGSIGAQAALCEGVYGRRPNVILVDMFDRGDVFAAQRTLNAY